MSHDFGAELLPWRKGTHDDHDCTRAVLDDVHLKSIVGAGANYYAPLMWMRCFSTTLMVQLLPVTASTVSRTRVSRSLPWTLERSRSLSAGRADTYNT